MVTKAASDGLAMWPRPRCSGTTGGSPSTWFAVVSPLCVDARTCPVPVVAAPQAQPWLRHVGPSHRCRRVRRFMVAGVPKQPASPTSTDAKPSPRNVQPVLALLLDGRLRFSPSLLCRQLASSNTANLHESSPLLSDVGWCAGHRNWRNLLQVRLASPCPPCRLVYQFALRCVQAEQAAVFGVLCATDDPDADDTVVSVVCRVAADKHIRPMQSEVFLPLARPLAIHCMLVPAPKPTSRASRPAMGLAVACHLRSPECTTPVADTASHSVPPNGQAAGRSKKGPRPGSSCLRRRGWTG